MKKPKEEEEMEVFTWRRNLIKGKPSITFVDSHAQGDLGFGCSLWPRRGKTETVSEIYKAGFSLASSEREEDSSV